MNRRVKKNLARLGYERRRARAKVKDWHLRWIEEAKARALVPVLAEIWESRTVK